jgi:hypothetical protein
MEKCLVDLTCIYRVLVIKIFWPLTQPIPLLYQHSVWRDQTQEEKQLYCPLPHWTHSGAAVAQHWTPRTLIQESHWISVLLHQRSYLEETSSTANSFKNVKHITFFPPPLNVSAEWLALLLHIWKVLGSNLSSRTGYPDWGFSWVSSVPLDKS